MSEIVAELLSDIDGTVVEKLSSKDPRQWWRNGTKRNLALMEGYPDFLRGVLSLEGIGMGGAATVRKEWMRRRSTLRSIRQHALEQFFLDPQRIAFGKTEKGKARVVGERSRKVAVGMIEDQPQKHVPELAAYARDMHSQGDVPHHPILVGVVAHPNAATRIEEMRSELDDHGFAVRDEPTGEAGLVIVSDPLTIHVTELGPYSQAEGEAFGQRLLDLAQKP